jgi:hypothetical protein
VVISSDDGRHRTALALDPSTGKLLYAEDIATLPVPSTSPIPTGNPLGISLIATVSNSRSIVSAPDGFDLNHDSAREFILRQEDGDIWTSRFEVWHSRADNVFQRVHVIDVPGSVDSYYPYDAGDADGDGLADLIVFGRTLNDFFIRLYESVSADTYPTQIVWELPDEWWAVGAKIEDTDNDGAKEIVVAGQSFHYEQRVAVYENDGDNSYTEIFYRALSDVHTSQSMEVADDLDGDGSDEVFFGGLIPGSSKLYAFESTANNCYQQIWSREMIHPDGQIVNAEFIRYAGDLDGDGKKEFLAGGLKTGPPWFTILYVFEAQADDEFEIVSTFSLPRDIFLDAGAAVADVDADRQNEIVFGSGSLVRVYRNRGDNAWEEVWADTATVEAVGAGDHDGDGAHEILYQQFGGTSVLEGILIDTDGDGLSNAADNCPFDANPPSDCDADPGTPDEQCDLDADGQGDACDSCPDDAANDSDLDGVCEGDGFTAPKIGDQDNCPFDANPPSDCDADPGTPDEQCDLDSDGQGDVCDSDVDGDTVNNDLDNCPMMPNDQTDTDDDSFGDVCDCAPGSNESWTIPAAIDSLLIAKTDSCDNFACSESRGPCSRDDECNYDFCGDFSCSLSGEPCSNDAECQMDFCNDFSCTVGTNPCLCDADCTADFCDNRQCVIGLNSCVNDFECSGDACRNMMCTETMIPCFGPFDCYGGPSDECVGECSASGDECYSDNDCEADMCLGECSVGANVCATDDDCTTDVCQGACSVGANVCTADDQCTADVCQGACDDDCTAAQTDLCLSSCTIGGNVCSGDLDCTAPGIDTLLWYEPEDFGGTGVVYDTLRSPTAADFTTPATCVETDGLDRITSDGTVPTAGMVLYYLIRVENGCPDGNMGSSWSGPRTGQACE